MSTKEKKLKEEKKECPGVLKIEPMKEFCFLWEGYGLKKWGLVEATTAWNNDLVKQYKDKCPEGCALTITVTLVDLGNECAEAVLGIVKKGRWVKGAYGIICSKKA